MAKTWNPGDSSRFAREAKLGTPYYYVNNLSERAGAFEDRQTYSTIVFDGRQAFTGIPTVGGYGAEALCRRFGPIYDQPPAGMRNAADAPPQVSGPLGNGYDEGFLDEPEIRGLEKQVAQSSDPRNRRRFL